MKKIRSLSLVLLITLAVTSCSRDREHTVTARKIKVPTEKVKLYAVNDYYLIPGRVKAENSITLASKTQGLVKKIFIKEGDRVRRGDMLIIIDDTDIQAKIKALNRNEKSITSQIKALKAKLDYAKANYKRFKNLLKEDAITREEFDRVKSQYFYLLNQIRSLKQQLLSTKNQKRALIHMLRYTRITAPEDGIITHKLVDEGTFINPGTPLVKMDSSKGGYEFIASIDAKLIERIKRAKELPVYIEDIHKLIIGKIKSISPHIDPKTNRFKIRLTLRDNNLLSGMFGRLTVPLSLRKTILIPETAIVRRGNINAVYRIDKDGKVHFQIVRLGYPYVRVNNQYVPVDDTYHYSSALYEVLSGLSEKDEIVIDQTNIVREGYLVER